MFDTTTLDGSMELRVWLEGGPQRVVCGVTEATTCQDVVYALAQATAQTGRFALVERSRRSERPLAPSDRPLRLLARWGRCASDVHFLLRRCGPAKAATTPRGSTAVQASPPLERVSHRPRRPPPYDEAVTRLAAGTHHLLPPRGGDPPLQGLGDSPSKQPPDDYSELLRVVSLQRERLNKIHEELAQKDAELSSWEEAPLEEQLHLSRQEERMLHSELTLARSQLATCEARLLQCRQHLCQLGHELSEEKRCQGGEEDLSEQLSERRRMVAQLSEELREANLEALALADADHKHWLEASGGFFNRPGSTRKIIGSPRQLESAVPTSKNPNGVWV
uniref:Ras association ralgds/af 6 domain family member 8 n=1 Tax=Rhipicephalus appendiculatus TaxID=34631 RepID=A0A131YP89_RHIAP